MRLIREMPTFVVINASLLYGQVSTIDGSNDTADHCVEGLVIKALGRDCVQQIPAYQMKQLDVLSRFRISI